MDERTQTLTHVIGGSPRGTATLPRANPAASDEVVSLAPDGTTTDVDDAVAAASEAAGGWAKLPAPARGAVLGRAAAWLADRIEPVARDLTREEGKTLRESRGEVQRAIDILTFFAGEGWRMGGETLPSATTGTLIYTARVPLGVVAVITPWNFPIAIPAWKIAPALVAGNAVVFKPASHTGLSAQHLTTALHGSGLPPGTLNLVHGSGSKLGAHLVDHPDVAAISFTGSVLVGDDIYAHAAVRKARVQLEMGGKNPLVVLADADVEAAAGIAAAGAFGLTGQACTATSRVIVEDAIHDRFLEAITARMDAYHPRNGLDDDALMGPVVSQAQLRTDLEALHRATQDGATIHRGGDVAEGMLLSPAVVTGVEPSHHLAQEEVFGPVMGIIRVSSFEEAIATANGVGYGLVAGICTNDLSKAHRFIDEAEAGIVKVNRPTTGLELNVPFGGIKASSTNTFREQGHVALDFYTWTKSVYLGFD